MTAELAELVALVRCWLGGRQLVEAPGTAVVALAREHRVSPLIYELAARSNGPAAAALATQLRPDFYRTLLTNDSLLAVAARACTALAGVGVPSVRLKGADLALAVYSSPGLRPMDDIDILIDERHLELAVVTLEAHGFVRDVQGLQLAEYAAHHFHLPLEDPSSGACLELHWQLMDRLKRGEADGSQLVQEAVDVDRDRPELGARLEPTLSVVYLAMHLDKHGPFHSVVRRHRGSLAAVASKSSEARLLWLVDLPLMMRRYAIDPGAVASTAAQLGVERAVGTSLRLAEDLLGCDLGASRLPEESGRFAGRVFGGMVAAVLVSPSHRVQRLLARASVMDPVAQVRPLRLLHLPIELLEGRRSVGRTLRELVRLGSFAAALLRHHIGSWLPRRSK